MKVKLTSGSRKGTTHDIPEKDAKKLINKGMAVDASKKAKKDDK